MSVQRKAYYILIGFFCFTGNMLMSQDKKLADSLITLYQSGSFQGDALSLLRTIAENETNPDSQLLYSQLLIERASRDSLYGYMVSGYLQKGYALHYKGNFDLALESFLESIAYANRIDYVSGVGAATISIADIYSEMGNPDNAAVYYERGIQILRTTDDSVMLATALINAGDEAFNNKKYDSALGYFVESGRIFKNIEYLVGTAYNMGNVGMVYAEQGRDSLAYQSINDAIHILEELEDYLAIAEYLGYMSNIYIKQDDHSLAISYSQRGLDLALKYGLKKQISESNLQLSELYGMVGDQETSFVHYKAHIAYRDSIFNLEKVQQLANLRTNYEVSQKQVEVDLLNQQKRNQLIILGFTGILLLTLFWYYRTISREKKKSERLLLNILPQDTARELKESGKVAAKKFESVTVMFSDFIGFTAYAETLPPEELVKSVDYYFSKFDLVMENHGLEKIKTIGDAYMCAGGLYNHQNDHAITMVQAAMEFLLVMEDSKRNGQVPATPFNLRIGINSGPVIAGVVGTKKFSYDIWGDAVNVASRLETLSEAGRINISESTYELVKDRVSCEYRGKIAVRNRGEMKMYFVGKNPEQSKAPMPGLSFNQK
jgi:class 3 adenylate cyclase